MNQLLIVRPRVESASVPNHQSHLEDNDDICKNLEPETQFPLRLHENQNFNENDIKKST